MTTFQSEYGKLRSVVMKRAADAFVNDEKIQREWNALNFLSAPNLARAKEEYHQLEKFIRESGTNILWLPPNERLTLDSIYCRDAAIATDAGMILCNMGKEARKAEPQAERLLFEQHQIPVLGEIQSPGTLEGGDVAWINSTTLAVGYTYRTNPEGIRQLKTLLEPNGIEVLVAHMPHYRGPSDVFHLMSVFSPVDKDLAVVYSPLMPIAFRNELLARGFTLVEVPDQEFDSMGCNVLAIGPRECIMVQGNPITAERLRNAGARVLEYEGSEISVKGGGGPTCLTRPLARIV